MRKSLLFICVTTAALFIGSSVFASSWTPPNNVRVVQQSRAGTSNVYTTIQAALNSIADASENNPYLVKIMPGIYSEGTVTLKPYVTLDGESPDTTVITSSNYDPEYGFTCKMGTVIMAENSSIRNIKVVNTPPALNSEFVSANALVFNNVKARAEGISVVSGSALVDGGVNNGICVSGASGHAIVNNSDVETYNAGVRCNPVTLQAGGSLTLKNSRLAGFLPAGENDSYGINSDSSGPFLGTVKVINTEIEVTAAFPHGIFLSSEKAKISNSSITLNLVGSNGWAEGFSAYDENGELEITNSRIISSGPINYYDGTGGKVRIADTQLPGDRTGLTGATFVNNFDENFGPILDQ